MAIKMRITKDKYACCNACGADKDKSIEIFDVKMQSENGIATVFHLCDRCMGEMFDKSLKARHMIDGMVKTPKQMYIINGRKQAEMRIREKENEERINKLKEMYKGDGD